VPGVDATQTLSIPEWDDPQGQLLEDTWLLTLFVAILASAFPWFVSSLNIDFASASWAVLTLGAVYVSLSLLAARDSGSGWRRRVLALLHAAGVIGLGFLWQSCGGLQNPAFLLAFALPVIGASGLSRGQPYLTAVLALLVVGAMSLDQAPELRWYFADLHAGGRWLAPLLGPNPLGAAAGGTATLGAFPGFYAPVGYDVVLLEVFAILVFACAVASESLGYAFQRLIDRLSAARGEAAQAQQLWEMLLQELPAAAALVDSETLQIVLASERFAQLCAVSEPLTGRPVLELLRLSYPERIRELIGSSGGSATVALGSADRLRVVDLRVQHLLAEGRRLALVLIEDISAAYCSGAALDADEHAVLVIDAGARLLAINKPARALFPSAATGADAASLLGSLGTAAPTMREAGAAALSARWWEPDLGGRRRLLVTISHRRYQVLCTAVALPGEEQAIYVVALAPAWPGASTSMTETHATPSFAGELR
jgi:hypothetical protein